MQFDVPVARRRRLSLAPLIDVIFLLLLFFMLSSTFIRFVEVEIRAGEAGAGGTGRPDAILLIDASGPRLNGKALEIETIPGRLEALSKAGAKTLVITLSRDVSSQTFTSVLQKVSTGPLSVSLARTRR
ncbi:MAG: biopolymer transporter ExbD [Nitratireductor sp.]|nr:biopolymer transporter ExbD [Nitratireductor sp.]